MVVDTIKKIFKNLAISFLGAYLPYLIYFTIIFLRGREPLLGNDISNFIGEAIFMGLYPLFSTPFIVLILYIASLIEKRVLNKWFVFSFSFYSSVIIIILSNFWDIWYSISFTLISLVVVIILMNIKRWIKN